MFNNREHYLNTRGSGFIKYGAFNDWQSAMNWNKYFFFKEFWDRS